MERGNSNRTKRIIFRLTPEEYAGIEKKWKASTCRKLSDYVRRSLFEKPVVTTFRNRSMDDLMIELGRLRTELNAIGNNFNQSVKRLHTLREIHEFKGWLTAYEMEKNALESKVEQVKNNVRKIMEIWLQ